jgi:hypothetical protein
LSLYSFLEYNTVPISEFFGGAIVSLPEEILAGKTAVVSNLNSYLSMAIRTIKD